MVRELGQFIDTNDNCVGVSPQFELLRFVQRLASREVSQHLHTHSNRSEIVPIEDSKPSITPQEKKQLHVVLGLNYMWTLVGKLLIEPYLFT